MYNLPSGVVKQPYKKKTLNQEKRKREALEISAANAGLLRRLKCKLPTYNVNQLESDRKKQECRLKAICEFPYKLGVSWKRKRRLHLSQRIKKSPIFEKREETLFRQGVSIGEAYFLVEIIRVARRIRIIVDNTDKPETYRLELSIAEANDLVGGTEFYQDLAKKLKLENGQLIIVGPSSKKANN